ncbi:MAG: quinone-dependent dihydroorotate dehydrogenase [Micrococcaceae bacterium]
MRNLWFSQGIANLLSQGDAEKAIDLSFASLKAAHSLRNTQLYAAPEPYDDTLTTQALGLEFSSPLGLAAGYDKNATAIDALADLGFAFVEIGTITAYEQSGSVKPRIFRLPEDQALINRTGFNNIGAKAVRKNLEQRALSSHHQKVKLGINIGKSKQASISETIEDLSISIKNLAEFADYIVLNLDTLDSFQTEHLDAQALLETLQTKAYETAQRPVPFCLKLSPDMNNDQLKELATIACENGIKGIFATNPTAERPTLKTKADTLAEFGAGGLSGLPLAPRSLAVLKTLKAEIGTELDIVSVGGIQNATDVVQRLEAGASLVQGLTAMIFQGSQWAQTVNTELKNLL